jgi:hypothetical protein
MSKTLSLGSRWRGPQTCIPSRRIAETHSGYKLLVEEGTDRILGAHILGSGAAEVINLFAVAIRSGVPATELKYTLFAYPTSGSSGSPSGLALQVHSNRLDGLATGRQFYSFDETGMFGGGHPSGFAQATRLPAIRIKIRSSLSLEVPR